jgi:hypothetical protein
MGNPPNSYDPYARIHKQTQESMFFKEEGRTADHGPWNFPITPFFSENIFWKKFYFFGVPSVTT